MLKYNLSQFKMLDMNDSDDTISPDTVTTFLNLYY